MAQQMETAAPAGGRPEDFVAAHDDQINKRFDTPSQGEITPFRSLGEVLTAALNRTPIDHPGPPWSGYVHKLRKLGLQIETIKERYGGPFAGHHARHVLRSSIP